MIKMVEKKARTTDKWKKKKWFEIIAPKIFNEQKVGKTVAEKPAQLVGRSVAISMRDITKEIKKSQINVKLKITKVEGTKAFTELIGFDTDKGYVRRNVRRRVSKIETHQTIETKDNKKEKISILAITAKKAYREQETAIRKIIEDGVTAFAKTKTYDQIMNDLLFGGATAKMFTKAKKVFPLKKLEVIKAELISV